MIIGIRHGLAGVGPGDYYETEAQKLADRADDCSIRQLYPWDYVIDTKRGVFVKNKDGPSDACNPATEDE